MSEYIEFIKEVFSKFGSIQPRRMFGGYGIFRDGVMFALVVDDTLYLKADKTIVHYFKDQNLLPFSYLRKGKLVELSYYQAPDDIFEDQDLASMWARRSFEIAYKARK